MILLWILLAVTFTVLLLYGKNIEPHNFVWALIPIDRYGITLFGFTLKPVYIYSIFLVGYYIVTKKFRIKITPSVMLSAVVLLISFIVSTFFRFGTNITRDITLYAMFFFTLVLAICIASMINGKKDLMQIKDVIIATAVGYGILFLIICLLDALGITLPDVKSARIWDNSVLRILRNVYNGQLIEAQKLRGFYLDVNAGSVCFVVGFAAIMNDWLEKGVNIRNIIFTAIISANILLTGSRTAIIAVIIIAALTIFRLFFTKLGSKRKLVFLSVFLLAIILLIVFLLYNTTVINKILDLISNTYFNRSSLNDDKGRLSIWRNALSSINSDTWYCGIGTEKVISLNSGIDAHSTFIEVICANGIPFGILYILFFLYPFVVAFKKNDESKVDVEISNIVLIYMSIVIMSSTVSHVSSVYLIYTAILILSFPLTMQTPDTSEGLIQDEG